MDIVQYWDCAFTLNFLQTNDVESLSFLSLSTSPSQEPTLVIWFLSGYILRRDDALRSKGVYAHSTQNHPACWPLSLSTNHFHIKSQSPMCIPPVFSLCSPKAANLTPFAFSLSDNLMHHLHQESQVPTVSTPANSLWFLPFPSSLQPQRKHYPSYSWKTLTPEKKKKIVFFWFALPLIIHVTKCKWRDLSGTQVSYPENENIAYLIKLLWKFKDSLLKIPHSMPDRYFVLSKCFLSISPFLSALLLIPSFELRSIKMENKNQLAFAMRHTETGNLINIYQWLDQLLILLTQPLTL